METLQHPFTATGIDSVAKTSVIQKILIWCKDQERNRLLWLAAMLTIHGCVITPITILLITLAGNSIILWPFAMLAMAMTVVTNLAALPTKITIPTFFISLVIDLVL